MGLYPKSSIELALKTGKAEGKAEEKIELTKQMVLKLIKENIAIDTIEIVTGLTKAEVELILNEENGDKNQSG